MSMRVCACARACTREGMCVRHTNMFVCLCECVCVCVRTCACIRVVCSVCVLLHMHQGEPLTGIAIAGPRTAASVPRPSVVSVTSASTAAGAHACVVALVMATGWPGARKCA